MVISKWYGTTVLNQNYNITIQTVRYQLAGSNIWRDFFNSLITNQCQHFVNQRDLGTDTTVVMMGQCSKGKKLPYITVVSGVPQNRENGILSKQSGR